MTLKDDIHEAIKALSAEGDDFVNSSDFAQAILKYQEALALLPPPVTQWDASTWLFTAIGEAFFFADDYDSARDALSAAMNCPDGLGNAFIHLRLGQVQYELGHEIIAADELTRAYMGGGKEIFAREDPKYFEFVTEKLIEPPDGW
jgi:tetratricopeptide (TPR) repeat protein